MLNVAVLYGGNSSEREVSINTSEAIINLLNKEKYNIIKICIPKNKNNSWVKKLLRKKIDFAIIALHGGMGENGSVQGLLECLGIPYIGTSVLGSAIGMNKFLAKQLLLQNGISTPKCVFINKNTDIDNMPFNLSFPLVVKPNEDGSSFGVSIVNNSEDLRSAINKIKGDILIEEYIEGQEVTCGVIEINKKIKSLGVLDINPSTKFYDYYAKYEANDTKIDSSTLSEDLKHEIENTAISVFKVLNARDYARIDMIIKNDKIYVLEINTLPGMTSHSLIPKSLEKSGIKCSEFFAKLIEEKVKE